MRADGAEQVGIELCVQLGDMFEKFYRASACGEIDDKLERRPRAVSMHSSELTDEPGSSPVRFPQQRQAFEVPRWHFVFRGRGSPRLGSD
jgi:hypothetical protein